MLWIGARLSALEQLSNLSFLANGHDVHLNPYGEIAGVPAGTIRRDAREVLPESEVFTYAAGFGKGSPSAFSNYFRYKRLLDAGGMWCDIDIVCLQPFEFAANAPYAIATERRHVLEPAPGAAAKLNPCLLQAPAGSAVMRECYEACAGADKTAVRWGEIGPHLASRKFSEHGLAHHALAPEMICPIDWWHAHELIIKPLPELPGAYAIHLWNEVWRYHGIDKDAAFAPGSAYETLKRRFGLSRSRARAPGREARPIRRPRRPRRG
jgi:hypothetical protein